MTKLKAYARGEMIIINAKARKKGDEIVVSGIIVGKEEHGEIPLTGVVVSAGSEVNQDHVKVGDTVLLPDSGRCQNVPDPRIVTKELAADSKDREIFITTHYKNVAVVYAE